MTVFLTTQYLEEADALADRVGSSTGAGSSPRARRRSSRREIGRPTVEAMPADPHDRERLRTVLERFGAPRGRLAQTVAVHLGDGAEALTDSFARSTGGIAVADLELHSPSLDDVFLAKTGRCSRVRATGRGGARAARPA